MSTVAGPHITGALSSSSNLLSSLSLHLSPLFLVISRLTPEKRGGNWRERNKAALAGKKQGEHGRRRTEPHKSRVRYAWAAVSCSTTVLLHCTSASSAPPIAVNGLLAVGSRVTSATLPVGDASLLWLVGKGKGEADLAKRRRRGGGGIDPGCMTRRR
jgi:hypothetical protein